ncbi:ras family-domain-containing protein [Hyaloscypha finlandica]|nr:ras family-domain-containing protein [Hyaloscypha finlandica]
MGRMHLYKLVVLGDGDIGKDQLAIQFVFNHFVETYDPTIEDAYTKQVVIDGQSCMVEVLDTSHQEEYTALRDQWIRDGEGFLLVYSISSRSSFTHIGRFHNQIQRVIEREHSGTQRSLPDTVRLPISPPFKPVMLVGNNCDRTTVREVSTQEGHALARELGCDFVEASSRQGINVEKAFYDVVRSIRRHRMQPALAGRPISGMEPPKRGGGQALKLNARHPLLYIFPRAI